MVLTLILSTILQNMAMCELTPLNKVDQIHQRRPILLTRSNHLRPIRSPSPAPAPSTGSANNLHKRATSSTAAAQAGVANQLTDLPAFANQDDNLPLAEDSYEEAMAASLAELSDKDHKIATVRLSNPNKLLIMLRQLAKDIAWSMFEQSYR